MSWTLETCWDQPRPTGPTLTIHERPIGEACLAWLDGGDLRSLEADPGLHRYYGRDDDKFDSAFYAVPPGSDAVTVWEEIQSR